MTDQHEVAEIVEVTGNDAQIQSAGQPDIHRCECGSATFRQVTVGAGSAYQYRCTNCRLLWYGNLMVVSEVPA